MLLTNAFREKLIQLSHCNTPNPSLGRKNISRFQKCPKPHLLFLIPSLLPISPNSRLAWRGRRDENEVHTKETHLLLRDMAPVARSVHTIEEVDGFCRGGEGRKVQRDVDISQCAMYKAIKQSASKR